MISNIILLRRIDDDGQYQAKTIEFSTSKINLIIGPENSGKTNIWHIINYCLNSSTCRISEAELTTQFEWFIITIQNKSKTTIVGRRSPAFKTTRSKDYCICEKVPQNASELILLYEPDYINKILELFPDSTRELQDIKIGKLGPLSYRDTTAFNYLPLRVQTSLDRCFNLHPAHPKYPKIKYAFPLFCEMVTPANFRDNTNEIDRISSISINNEIDKIGKLINPALSIVFNKLKASGHINFDGSEYQKYSIMKLISDLSAITKSYENAFVILRDFLNNPAATNREELLDSLNRNLNRPMEKCGDILERIKIEKLATVAYVLLEILFDQTVAQRDLELRNHILRQAIQNPAEVWLEHLNTILKRLNSKEHVKCYDMDNMKVELRPRAHDQEMPPETSDFDSARINLALYLALHYPRKRKRSRFLAPLLFIEQAELALLRTDETTGDPTDYSSIKVLTMLTKAAQPTQVFLTSRSRGITTIDNDFHIIDLFEPR